MKKLLLLLCFIGSSFVANAKSSAIPALNLSSVIGDPVTMQMEDYRDGGEGVAYNDTDVANKGGEYRLAEGVDIQSNGDGFNICYGEASEWLEYSINVPVSGLYSFDFYVASPQNDVKFYVDYAGKSSTTLTVPNTGGWQSWQIGGLTLDLVAGAQNIRFNIAAGGNLDKAIIKLVSTRFSTLSALIGQPVTMQMEDYRDGGEGVAYHDNTLGNQGLGYNRNDDVDISHISSTEYYVSYVEAGEWLEYSIEVPVSGLYSFDFLVASPSNDVKFYLDYPDGPSSIITVPNTGSWSNWKQGNIQLNLKAGFQIIRLNIVAGGNFDKAIIKLLPKVWDNRPVTIFPTNTHNQVFNNGWDNSIFYGQWSTIDPNTFAASDVTAGYLQFVWPGKRIIYSNNACTSYRIVSDIEYTTGSSRGGIVLRVTLTNIDNIQEPAGSGIVYNRHGIAFYPSDDGTSMYVQFSGTIGTTTPTSRISVPKPAGVANLRNRGTLRIEDFGTSVYVFYNNSPFIRIELGGVAAGEYTSGTVYDSEFHPVGAFSGMKIPIEGKVAIGQRDANLRLYSVSINTTTLLPQTIPYISKKQITDAPFALPTASSGLPVTYTLITGPATLSGNQLSLTGQPGVVTISAIQSGDANYAPLDAIRNIWVYDPAVSNVNSTSQDYVDNWVATDALSRTLPTYDLVGSKKTNKTVGVFYYINQGQHGNKEWDITKIIDNYPSDPLSTSNTTWGDIDGSHWWGEPEEGYFRAEDPWYIRRNLQMLSNAKVDFIYFDVTNAFTYLETVKSICNISMQMRKEGIYTPKIVFTTAARSGETMNLLYDQFYSQDLFMDLWFKWDDKPLIFGDINDPELRSDVKIFFTIKYSWAWTDAKTKPNHWQWLDTYPQDFGWSVSSTTPEQIPVAIASHPTLSVGKSFSNGLQPTVNNKYLTEFTGQGLNAAQQWKRALEVDPPVIMVSQWNEWNSGRSIWDQGNSTYAGRPIKNGDSYFVDVFSQEFNRDMAPMKGGHTDNYYYQLISNIRKYKGMAEPQVFSMPATITIDDNFADWATVTPVYKDAAGDVMHRNFAGTDPTHIYTNTTGRNDIIESRATYDANCIYFYVKTVANITPYTDPNWMLLFIDADRNKATGWQGYDYVVNLGVANSTSSTLSAWTGSSWAQMTYIPFRVSGNQMELCFNRSSVGLSSSTPQFYFHWADNPQQLNDITAFFTDGESAPDRRFNYDFTPPQGITNGCFESPSTATYQYGPFTSGWTFGIYTGVQRNSSIWGAPTAPEGIQTAFIQQTGVITQNVNFIAGSYKVGFYAAKRAGDAASQTLKVYYDATLIATITPASSSTWTYYTTNAFTATAGAHSIKFVGQATTGYSAFVDAVDVVLQTTLTNGGFETPATTSFIYSPFTNGWTFLAESNGLSGVQKNGSAWGAPTAPEGTQTAFLQAAGRIYQDLAFAAGSYKITFYAAYRSINTQTQSVNVYCDGTLIGNITPASSSSFGFYSTNRFTVAAGTHRIMFANVKSLDDIFIDNVNIVLGGYKAPELLTKLENLDLEITIYPNPALSQITLSNVQLNSQISIFTLDGKKVYSMLKKDSEPLSILVNSWFKGVYLVHIHNDNGIIIKKVIIK